MKGDYDVNIYLLLKVEFGPRSTGRPTVISGHSSESVAQNKALHVFEDYVKEHKGGYFNEKVMRAWDANGQHGIQLNIVKVTMSGIQLAVAEQLD